MTGHALVSADCAMRQNGVNADHAVDDLRDVQIDGQAGERNRVEAFQPVLLLHEREHRFERGVGRVVEVVAEADRQPALSGCGRAAS